MAYGIVVATDPARKAEESNMAIRCEEEEEEEGIFHLAAPPKSINIHPTIPAILHFYFFFMKKEKRTFYDVYK